LEVLGFTLSKPPTFDPKVLVFFTVDVFKAVLLSPKSLNPYFTGVTFY
jgi:hypothetical protein